MTTTCCPHKINSPSRPGSIKTRVSFLTTANALHIFLSGSAYDLFDRDCVTEHNRLRRLHGAQPLSWSESLAEDAQKWAEYLAINDRIEHDGDTLAEKDEGENIAWFVPPQPKCQGAWKPNCVTCGEVVQNWYDESENYNYQTGAAKKPDLPVKHFAQVWSVFCCCSFNRVSIVLETPDSS